MRLPKNPRDRSSADPEEPAPSETANISLIRSADLFEGARRLRIEHNGDYYMLQVTRQNKLILTR
jgi:hemin uptake protein HemP